MSDERPSLTALRLQTEQPTREDFANDGPICARCHAPFMISSEMELTAICDPCAQAFVQDDVPLLLEIAAAVMQRSIVLTAIEEDRSKAWDDVYKADLRIKATLAKVRP